MRKEVTRAILLNEDGEVLLGKRVRGTAAGKWALIGGKLEEGETPEEAVVREVNEEIGIDFAPTFFEKIEDSTSIDDEHSWDVYVYFGSFAGEPRPKLDENSEIVFVSKGTLGNFDIAYNHKELLERFFDTIAI